MVKFAASALWSSVQAVASGQVCMQWLVVKFFFLWLALPVSFLSLLALLISCFCRTFFIMLQSLGHFGWQQCMVPASISLIKFLQVVLSCLHACPWSACPWSALEVMSLALCVCALEVLAKLVFLACLLACLQLLVSFDFVYLLPSLLAGSFLQRSHRTVALANSHQLVGSDDTGLLACLLCCTAWSDQVPPLSGSVCIMVCLV